MTPLTLLLTGAGGAASPGLAAHLRALGCRVLMADMDPHAAGLLAADKGFVIPAGVAPEFVPAIRRICAAEAVDVFIPLVDEELLAAQDLETAALRILTPRREFIETCLDKLALMRRLADAHIAVPATRRASEVTAPLERPSILKPRTGRGSRGVVRIRTSGELASALRVSSYPSDGLILQDYVDGPEFTVSVVVWRDGEVQAVVPKQIIVKRGITHLAVTRRHPRIDELCHRIQAALRADGPFNVQLRLHPESGEPLPFEINPRFSTTVSLTAAAGIEEIHGLAVQTARGRDAYVFGDWKDGLVLRRRSVDEFQDEPEFERERAQVICVPK